MKISKLLIATILALPVFVFASDSSSIESDPMIQRRLDYILKICDEVPSAGGAVTAMNMIDPASRLVGTFLMQSHSQLSSSEEGSALEASVKLTQLENVKHGLLIPHSPNGRVFYEYLSKPGYVGKDQAIFMAEFKGKYYKIVANIIVTMNLNENAPQCHKPVLIKITKSFNGAN